MNRISKTVGLVLLVPILFLNFTFCTTGQCGDAHGSAMTCCMASRFSGDGSSITDEDCGCAFAETTNTAEIQAELISNSPDSKVKNPLKSLGFRVASEAELSNFQSIRSPQLHIGKLKPESQVKFYTLHASLLI